MTFRIEYAPEAVDHMAALPRHQAKMVLDQVERKLRLGVLRVYFDVSAEPTPVVTVRAIGVKVRDRVWIAGEEVDLDEDD